MADDIYVLDLIVTGADAVSVFDDGTGSDTIVVKGVYAATIDIDLAWTTVSGVPINAGSRYVSADNHSHDLLIHGQIENAYGSNGTEVITGNTMDNFLSGDRHRTGPGMADTIWGGGGDDSIFGGTGDDALNGEAEDDALWGDAGNDRLTAGSGRDTVEGGAGADLLDGGGDAGDTLSYATSRGGVFVTLQTGAVTQGKGGDAEGDQITGFGAVIGSAQRDRIEIADKAALPQGAGDNQIYGGGARDHIAAGGDDDRVYGGTGNDLVFGEMGNDTMSGDSGKDWLFGGFGQDMLTGGSGADRFVFADSGESPEDHPDLISDFNHMELDRIDLKAIDADPGLAGNQAFHLIGGDFTNAAGEVQVEVQDGDLRVSGDINGDGIADFAIFLQCVTVLVAADFIL